MSTWRFLLETHLDVESLLEEILTLIGQVDINHFIFVYLELLHTACFRPHLPPFDPLLQLLPLTVDVGLDCCLKPLQFALGNINDLLNPFPVDLLAAQIHLHIVFLFFIV